MGVTVHCFALEPSHYDEQNLDIDAFLEKGIVDESLVVQPEHLTSFVPLETPMGGNKKWYLNFQADDVYSAARLHLADHDRERIDDLLSHLFWKLPWSEKVPQSPREVGEMTWLYSAELIDQILAHSQTDLTPLLEVLPQLQREQAQDRTELFWDPEMFRWWVDVWLKLFREARTKGKEWALLMWVWV